MAFKNEKVFNGEIDIKYLFQKSYKKTKNLVIVFSGIPPVGKKPSYNYIRTLQNFDCNKLFILDDFGCRASYYLCEKRNYAIENSVISLINHIIKEYDIENTLACGSSKGGYASLYYGLKYGFNHIVAASPQFLLGDYLLEQTHAKNIASFMAGGTEQEDHEYLNTIMSNMIKKTHHRPNIFIHLGSGEMHYKKHVKPLLNLLAKEKIDYNLDLGNYTKHAEVALFYPPILQQKIVDTFGYPLIKSLTTKTDNNTINEEQTFIVGSDSKDNLVAWYLFYNKERIHVQNYSKNNTFTIKFDKPGTYDITAFVKNAKKMTTTMRSAPILIETNS